MFNFTLLRENYDDVQFHLLTAFLYANDILQLTFKDKCHQLGFIEFCMINNIRIMMQSDSVLLYVGEQNGINLLTSFVFNDGLLVNLSTDFNSSLIL